MTGAREENSRCPICGGRLRIGKATVPFTLDSSVVVVKGVPAEICASCHEPCMAGAVVDRVLELLRHVRECGAEVSVVSFQPGEAGGSPEGEEQIAAAAA